jgi:hypothetical protein
LRLFTQEVTCHVREIPFHVEQDFVLEERLSCRVLYLSILGPQVFHLIVIEQLSR